MKQVTFRFYEELNDFLKAEMRKKAFSLPFIPDRTTKDWIESLGVPHTEVDLILVNGESADFNRIIKAGDYVSVYPVFESLNISGVTRLSPVPLRQTRFVADVHLGKLARYLRLLGFDTKYRNNFSDAEILSVSAKEKRIILTMDRGLLKHREVSHGFCILSSDPMEQVRSVLDRFDLYASINPFTRCMVCNGDVNRVEKEGIEKRLKPKTRKYYSEFYQCSQCGRIFWEGSHVRRMKRQFEEFLKTKRADGISPLRSG